MSANGQVRAAAADGAVLRWQGRVLTAEDVRRSVNGQRELVLEPRVLITPLAQEQLRAQGVRVTRQAADTPAKPAARWGYAQERPEPIVDNAVRSLVREGLTLTAWPAAGQAAPCAWARSLAECIVRGECQGGVLFCQDPGLVCCVANKVAGLRAAAAASPAQAARAARGLAANLVAVEMPGRTFFEVRLILRTLCAEGPLACPPGLACTLKELDGDAHR
jgi:hypothetical protein